ncbi:MAG: hypothetical protein M0Z95_15285 [Actinomycetota bacterium]|nr:hypothetical protein [Actinomycetota bacterium]
MLRSVEGSRPARCARGGWRIAPCALRTKPSSPQLQTSPPRSRACGPAQLEALEPDGGTDASLQKVVFAGERGHDPSAGTGTCSFEALRSGETVDVRSARRQKAARRPCP